MTFDLSPEQEQARTIEHMGWFIRHPEAWKGGKTSESADIPVISWPEGVEPALVDNHDHYGLGLCCRTATETIDGQLIFHTYAPRINCDDVCTACGKPLTGDETGHCHRCEHGDDDTNEVA